MKNLDAYLQMFEPTFSSLSIAIFVKILRQIEQKLFCPFKTLESIESKGIFLKDQKSESLE